MFEPGVRIKSVSLGFPSVRVPVLSKTIVSPLPRLSRASPFLNRIPFEAPTPVPTIIAVGVARPRAQGHEITSTAIPIDKANAKSFPAMSQIIIARIAIPITIGTKYRDISSASFEIGAFELCASSTNVMILESVVSAPTFEASKMKDPVLLIDPAITVLPSSFSTGIDSPVKRDSSTEERPLVITPSTGIFSPGLIWIKSPTLT